MTNHTENEVFNPSEKEIKIIIEQCHKKWIDAYEFLEEGSEEDTEGSIPIIYFDGDYADWNEEGNGSFWADTKVIFSFSFNHTEESDIEIEVRNRISNYIDEQEIS